MFASQVAVSVAASVVASAASPRTRAELRYLNASLELLGLEMLASASLLVVVYFACPVGTCLVVTRLVIELGCVPSLQVVAVAFSVAAAVVDRTNTFLASAARGSLGTVVLQLAASVANLAAVRGRPALRLFDSGTGAAIAACL